MAQKKDSQNVYIGILTPSGWDEKGNILTISLQTIDENEYIIEKNEMEMELRSYINEKLQVKGKVKKRMDGKKSLHVEDYKPVDVYDESLI